MKKTKLLNSSKQEDINKAIAILTKGGIVALPTETVYGLAADAKNENAVKKIFEAKGRPVDHPLIVHISSYSEIEKWANDIPISAKMLAKKFWPGPLTLLLKKSKNISSIITGGLENIALRVPNQPIFLNILEKMDTGLAAPSANIHKRVSPTQSSHVFASLYGRIDAILDGGDCKVGIESTIVDLTSKTPRILRYGPITKQDIEKVLGYNILAPKKHSKKVSGNMKVHYQPYTKLKILDINEIKTFIEKNDDKKIAVMQYSKQKLNHKNLARIKMPSNKSGYAKILYNTLHKIDEMKVDLILVELPPKDWSDVLDRLLKASAKN